LQENQSEGNIDGFSSSDDVVTLVLAPEAIQKVEGTTEAPRQRESGILE
jgi:hypothetical protein